MDERIPKRSASISPALSRNLGLFLITTAALSALVLAASQTDFHYGYTLTLGLNAGLGSGLIFGARKVAASPAPIA